MSACHLPGDKSEGKLESKHLLLVQLRPSLCCGIDIESHQMVFRADYDGVPTNPPCLLSQAAACAYPMCIKSWQFLPLCYVFLRLFALSGDTVSGVP